MLEEPPILTVKRGFMRPTEAQLAALAGAQTGHLVDCMDGRGGLHIRVKPIDPDNAHFCGPALTVHAYPADNLAIHAALDAARPGDVVIVATDGFAETAIIGDLLCGMLKNKGVTAFVTDGVIRDVDGVRAVGIPVFCAGVTPNSPMAVGPGTVGLPVHVGGRRVEPGDALVGDRDGVVAVPRDRIDAVAARLAQIRDMEAEAEAKVKGGLAESAKFKAFVEAGKVREL